MGLEAELARFGQPDSYLVQTNAMMREKRDKMCAVLKEVGLRPIVPEGGYFVLVDTTSLGKDFDTEGPDKEPYDFQLAKWMIREKVCTDLSPLMNVTISLANMMCISFLVLLNLFFCRVWLLFLLRSSLVLTIKVFLGSSSASVSVR